MHVAALRRLVTLIPHLFFLPLLITLILDRMLLEWAPCFLMIQAGPDFENSFVHFSVFLFCLKCKYLFQSWAPL